MSKTIQHENRTLARSSRNRGDMGELEHSTQGRRSGLLRSALLGMLIAVFLTVGCRHGTEPEKEPELEAVDVAPGISIETENDQQAVVPPPSLVGILPDDFPDGLPLYLPASLVDFGPADGGWVYVNLLTSHSRAKVVRGLDQRLRDAGWTITESGGVRQLRRGNSRVRLRIEDARPGTQYRFEYPG